ncbi:MAG: hypothetical protein IJ862_00385 [Selenomonadaceae bacterium]|nr:hypothetical protein [Selenomonadaceae bacterium]
MSKKSTTAVKVSDTYTTVAENIDKDNETIEVAGTTDVVTEAYVDRIEVVEQGVDKAVLYFGEDDEKVVMPVSMLPKDVKADDTLVIKVSFAD